MKIYGNSNLTVNHINPVIISDGDFNTLNRMLQQVNTTSSQQLSEELDKAIVVRDDAFPSNTIGLNSVVTIVNMNTSIEHTFSLVMPGEQGIGKRSVSILSNLGITLLGFRQGEEIAFENHDGTYWFKIKTVINLPVQS